MKRSLIVGMALLMALFSAGDLFGATLDLTGTWTYSTTDNWVTGSCPPSADTTATCTISQNGDEFALVLNTTCQPQSMCIFRGTVSGATYTCSNSAVVDEEGGVATNTMVFSATSNTSASGSDSSSYVHPQGFQCDWGFNIIFFRDPSDDGSESNPPDKPRLIAPQDGAMQVPLAPTLQTAAFSDPDPGDTHQQTQWQLSRVVDSSLANFIRTSDTYLTSFPLPPFLLDEDTTYYWRARFSDNSGLVSEWSDVYSFTTLTTYRDLNGNGIPDEQEFDLTVDLDNDGIPDIQQDDIKGVNTLVGQGRMGVRRRLDPRVTGVDFIEAIDPNSISRMVRPRMQLGLIVVKLRVATPGDTVRVRVFFSRPAPEGAKWFKYDPRTRSMEDYSEHATFSLDRMSVILELQDGGYGDFDGVANGVIFDPGGFGVASWVKGLVFDSSTNQPIGEAELRISESELKADVDGNYISMMLPGTYDVSVSADGYEQKTFSGVEIIEGGITTQDFALEAGTTAETGNLVSRDLWIRAVIHTEEKGPVEAVWQKGGEDSTTAGDRVIWGHFYASPSDVGWGSQNNPDLFVKIWFDHGGRLDVNFFHVSVPDIEVYSDYIYDGLADEQGTTTMSTRYIRQYYDNGQSFSVQQSEDGNPPGGDSASGNPVGYPTINGLRFGSVINTVEKGEVEALWQLGGQDSTTRGDQVVWGHFYASPSEVPWGSENNPDLFVKIWFDAGGRLDVNFFHVSVPEIEVYSDFPNDSSYDQEGTTTMENRYIRHEYQ